MKRMTKFIIIVDDRGADVVAGSGQLTVVDDPAVGMVQSLDERRNSSGVWAVRSRVEVPSYHKIINDDLGQKCLH